MQASISLEIACARYLQALALERRLSPATVEAYGRDLQQLRQDLVGRGADALDAVSPSLLEAWLGTLGKCRRPSSQNRALSACRQLFLYAQRQGWLRASPALRLRAARQARPLPTMLGVDAVARLLALAPATTPAEQRDRALLELLYGSGLRASEACRLRLRDLLLSEGLVRPQGKGGRERQVPLSPQACADLQAYLKVGRPAQLQGRPSAYVFIGNCGQPLSRAALYNGVRRACQRAGLPGAISPHTLRHAFATHLLAGGANLRAVQALLGHASLATTEIYTHLTASGLQATVAAHHPMGAAQIGQEGVDYAAAAGGAAEDGRAAPPEGG